MLSLKTLSMPLFRKTCPEGKKKEMRRFVGSRYPVLSNPSLYTPYIALFPNVKNPLYEPVSYLFRHMFYTVHFA
jgi:hypothetical protein